MEENHNDDDDDVKEEDCDVNNVDSSIASVFARDKRE